MMILPRFQLWKTIFKSQGRTPPCLSFWPFLTFLHNGIEKDEVRGIFCQNCIKNSRAATNVRTFEYYSFEIFTNELFWRTNVRWRPLVYFWLKHCGAKFRPRAWEPCMQGATLEILRWRLSCPRRRAAEKEAVTWTFNLKRSMKDNPSKVSNTF